MPSKAEVTHLDGQRLGRGGEVGPRRVLRTREDAEAAAARVASAALSAASVTQKVRSLHDTQMIHPCCLLAAQI